MLGVAGGFGEVFAFRVWRDQLITSESSALSSPCRSQQWSSRLLRGCAMTSTMSRPDLHHGPPLQLDFSTIAPRITTGTATPIKQKVHRLRAGRTSHHISHKSSLTNQPKSRTVAELERGLVAASGGCAGPPACSLRRPQNMHAVRHHPHAAVAGRSLRYAPFVPGCCVCHH